jgi:iron-sulfur cluster insertion protein
LLYITENAAAKVKEIATEEGLDGKNLRVKVVGGGCAGFNYDLFFDDNDALPLDEVFEKHGVTIVIDPLSYQYLIESEIDFVESLYGAGFKFNNPNVSSMCGCGQSFSV